MIKYIQPQEIIKTEQFIREPVDSLSKAIIESSSVKIILNGGRGSGKSLILYNIQDKGLGTENQTILIQFDSIINFSAKPNGQFDELFFNHYYELIFSLKLLSYIKRNYILTYESYFKDIEALLEDILKDTDNYIRKVSYEKRELKNYLFLSEISAEILQKFRKALGINTLTLAIDRFDWVNGSSAYTQQIISKYFEFFDKVIITSDDLSLDKKNRQEKLKNRRYSFVTTTYGKNLDVIKQIIRKRIKLYNAITDNPRRFFNEDIMTDQIYNNLVDKCNGNISLILSIFKVVAEQLSWYDENNEVLRYLFDTETDKQLINARQVEKIGTIPPKFHL